jgi:hypothetical protein
LKVPGVPSREMGNFWSGKLDRSNMEGFDLHGGDEAGFGRNAGEKGVVPRGLVAPELEMGVVGALVAVFDFRSDAAAAAGGGLAVFEVDVAIPVGAGLF